MKLDFKFIIKSAITYCMLSAGFSFLGIVIAEKGPLETPIGGLSLYEISGHVLWGLVAGAASINLRYVILTGFFAILIDSDHLIALTHIDAVSRMSHSIVFGIVAVIIMMIIFGKKDYLLGASAAAGVLAHLSFDIFTADDGKFPFFTPFYNHAISFPNAYWIYFEIVAVVIVMIAALLTKKTQRKNCEKLTK